jgi:hypothetical protein
LVRIQHSNPEYFAYAGGLVVFGIVLWLVNRLVMGRAAEIEPERLP